jgi:hypothetical protein
MKGNVHGIKGDVEGMKGYVKKEMNDISELKQLLLSALKHQSSTLSSTIMTAEQTEPSVLTSLTSGTYGSTGLKCRGKVVDPSPTNGASIPRREIQTIRDWWNLVIERVKKRRIFLDSVTEYGKFSCITNGPLVWECSS